MKNKFQPLFLSLARIVYLIGILQIMAIGNVAAQESANVDQSSQNASIQAALEQLRKSNALPFPIPMMMQPPPL